MGSGEFLEKQISAGYRQANVASVNIFLQLRWAVLNTIGFLRASNFVVNRGATICREYAAKIRVPATRQTASI